MTVHQLNLIKMIELCIHIQTQELSSNLRSNNSKLLSQLTIKGRFSYDYL